VSKLRENAKLVIGVGVKNSTSDLLIKNCDEFLFYDDLVKENTSKRSKRKPTRKKVGTKKTASTAPNKKSEGEKQDEGIDLVVDIAEALIKERGDSVFGSMVKQTLKRRNPGFSESYYGFRSFGDLLEEAQSRGVVTMELDERSGGYVIRSVSRD